MSINKSILYFMDEYGFEVTVSVAVPDEDGVPCTFSTPIELPEHFVRDALESAAAEEKLTVVDELRRQASELQDKIARLESALA